MGSEKAVDFFQALGVGFTTVGLCAGISRLMEHLVWDGSSDGSHAHTFGWRILVNVLSTVAFAKLA